MGSEGVSFFERKDIGGIVTGIFALLGKLWEGDAVLVEEFLPTIPSHMVMAARDIDLKVALRPAAVVAPRPAAVVYNAYQLEMDGDGGESDTAAEDEEIKRTMLGPPPLPKQRMGMRLRSMVARNPDGTGRVVKMVCGIGPASKPINGDNTIPISLDAVLDQWGIHDPKLKDRITSTIEEESLVVLQALLDYEETLTDEEKGGKNVQTDFIGLDFVITNNGLGGVSLFSHPFLLLTQHSNTHSFALM